MMRALFMIVVCSTCVGFARAQVSNEPCLPNLRMTSTLDSTTTYALGHYHINGLSRKESKRLHGCLAFVSSQPVVLNRSFVSSFCKCNTKRIQVEAIQVDFVDANDPKGRVTMSLNYVDRKH